MALPSSLVVEIRTTGSDSNGGGFDPGVASPGTDYSQQDSPQITYSDLVIGGTTTQLTSAGNPFSSVHAGNNIQVSGGTGFTVGVYNIRSVSGSTATMDRSVGTGASSGGAGKLGGAWATPGFAGGFLVGGMDFWVKSGTYTISSATANISGGPVSQTSNGSNANQTRWEGYGSARGDKGTRPVFQLSASLTASAITIFSSSANQLTIDNINVDANTGNTTATGFALSGSNDKGIRLKASNCTVNGISLTGASGGFLLRCEATGCSGTAGITLGFGQKAYSCESHDNTCPGFNCSSAGASLQDCLAYANSGGSSDGIFGNGNAYCAHRCNCYNNGRSGFDLAGGSGAGTLLTACVSYGNAGEGFHSSVVCDGTIMLACAGGVNASGNYNTTNLRDSGAQVNVEGFITLTADPFTAASSGDFSTNTTAGGGALLRAAGVPGSSPRGATTSKPDVGFAQHADPLASASSSWFEG